MSTEIKHNGFLEGPIFAPMIYFAIPIFFSLLFQQLYNTADTYIVGHMLGEEALASIGAASPVYDLLVGFALGFGNGLSIVTARYFGSGDRDLLKRSVAAAVVTGAAVVLAVTVLAQLVLMPLMVLLNTPEEILGEAYRYSATITRFTVVMFAYNLCAGVLRAIGNSLMPLVFLVFSSVVNVLLDWVFIGVLDRGVGGAAEATVIAQGLATLLCLLYIAGFVPILVPRREHFRPSARLYMEAAGQGVSMGFMSCFVSAGSVILQSGINGLGYLTIAAHTAARRLYQFFNMPFIAMMQAIGPFVSQNFGAGQPVRVRRAVLYGYLYSAGMTLVISAVVWIFAPELLGAISGSRDAEVLACGARYLRVVAPCYVLLSVLNITRTSLQAIGNKLLPVAASVIELIGKILFTAYFVPKLQYTAVIICEPVIWCFMTAELLAAFWFSPFVRSGKELFPKSGRRAGTSG